jgi:hypothetical protein
LYDEVELLGRSKQLRTSEEELVAARLIQLVEMHLEELGMPGELPDPLLKVDNLNRNAVKVCHASRIHELLDFLIARFVEWVAVEEKIGDNVVYRCKVLGIGGHGEAIAFDGY